MTKSSLNKDAGFTLWFTGLPCSGKTTLADAVAELLRKRNMRVERLDGDIVRKRLTKDLGFSKEDRNCNIERITFVAHLLSRNGVAVLSSFVSPYIERREKTRKEIEQEAVFAEVYVKCSVEECKRRDVKGMYAKALAGEIKDFTGVDDPYEEPTNPEVLVETDKESVEESTHKIIRRLGEMGLIAT